MLESDGIVVYVSFIVGYLFVYCMVKFLVIFCVYFWMLFNMWLNLWWCCVYIDILVWLMYVKFLRCWYSLCLMGLGDGKFYVLIFFVFNRYSYGNINISFKY